MGFVFISYSRQDTQIVDSIVSRLKSDGFEVWIDRSNIKGGDLWTVAIVEAIDTADSFVLMLSPSSTASDNVRKEVQLAQDAKRKLFPLLIAAVKLPPQFRYPLAGIQMIEFVGDPEAKYRELVEVLNIYRKNPADIRQPETRQVEVVFGHETLPNFGVRKEEKLLNLISGIIDLARSRLRIAKLQAGSVHAFIEIPTHGAYILKTAALNRDKRLLHYGIDAVRLNGDENYVLVESGEIGPLNLPKRRYPFVKFFLWVIIGFVILLGGLRVAAAGIRHHLLLTTPTATMRLTLFRPDTLTPSNIPTHTPTLTPTHTNTSTSTPTLTPTQSPSPTNTPKVIFSSNKPRFASETPVPADTKKPYCILVWETKYDPDKKEYYKEEVLVCK